MKKSTNEDFVGGGKLQFDPVMGSSEVAFNSPLLVPPGGSLVFDLKFQIWYRNDDGDATVDFGSNDRVLQSPFMTLLLSAPLTKP